MRRALSLAAVRREGWISALAELTKARISVASMLSGGAGYVACARAAHGGLVLVSLGTLLMAMAASTLNEIQERRTDALMHRTMHRPLVTGFFTPGFAGALTGVLGASGFAILLALGGWVPALLGLLAMVWYNGLYTPLKRMSAYAAIPGSFIGALPPLIGWTAAGGGLFAPPILGLSALLFIWQVPHFWLLLFIYGDDYARAGFPVLSGRMSQRRLARVICAWMAAAAVSCLLLPLLGTVHSLPATVLIALCAAWVGGSGIALLRQEMNAPASRRAFMAINLFALLVMAGILLDPLFS